MIKKLIPAAVLLSLFGAAQAEVSVYGLVDVSYGKNEIGVSSEKDATFHSGGDNGSSQGNSTTKVGLKGSTDVAKGIKANFQLETNGIQSDGTISTPFFKRQAWVGLSGNFGAVTLGKQDAVVFKTMAGFDLNGAANAASAQQNAVSSTWMGADFTTRQSRSLQYSLPAMGSFNVTLGFQPKDETGVENEMATYSAGATYTVGKLAVAIAAETKHYNLGSTAALAANVLGSLPSNGSSFSSVAASYDFGVAKVMAGYANGGLNFTGSNIGIVAPVAGYNVGLNYSKNSDTNAVATEFFVNREVFKNTTAYFDYGNLDKANAVFVKGNAYAVGMIYTF